MAPAPDAGGGWTEREALAVLWRHFAGRYAVLVQVPASDAAARASWQRWIEERQAAWRDQGEPPVWAPEPATRRIDALLWAPGDRIAVEVKVSRADYLADVRNPAKQRTWRELAHRHAYAVPAGLVSKAEVPATSGLLALTRSSVGWAKRAPMHVNAPPELPGHVLHVLMRRLAYAESHLKGHGHAVPADPEQLAIAADRAQRQLEVTERQLATARRRAEHYRKLASAGQGWPCEACGRALTATWTPRRGEVWRHVHAEDQQACEAARAAAVAARRAAGEKYARDPGPRPAEEPPG